MPAILAFPLLNQSQFIIITKNWKLGYCPHETQIETNIWKSNYKQHKNSTVLSHPSPKDGYLPRAADGDGEGQEEC